MVRGLTCTRWVSWLSQGSAAASLAGSHTRIPLHTLKDSNCHTVKKVCPDEAFNEQVIIRSLRSHQVLLGRGWWQGIFVQFSEERDPRVRHNGTSVDTTPGPREGKVVGGVVPLWELAIRADVVVASTCWLYGKVHARGSGDGIYWTLVICSLIHTYKDTFQNKTKCTWQVGPILWT